MAARSDVDQYDAHVLENFVDGAGRLLAIPAQHKKRLSVLRWLVEDFEPGRRYPEAEVNQIIGRRHSDFAALRRHLVDEELMQRRSSIYWRTGSMPNTGHDPRSWPGGGGAGISKYCCQVHTMSREALRMLAASAGAVLVLACACQGGAVGSGPRGVWFGPELSTGGPTNWSMNGLPAAGPSDHRDIGSMFLCLTGPGRAVITDVRPVRPVGTVEVVAFAVRPNPILRGGDMLGSGAGTLQDNGFNTADRIVDTQCVSGSGQGYELGLELTVPPGTNAGTTGFQIDYTVGGGSANLTYPAGAILCSTPSVDDAPCKRLLEQFGLSTALDTNAAGGSDHF